MYRKTSQSELTPENFELPFQGKLSSENRWVIMAELIPWSDKKSEYAENFSETIGAIAKPFRMALGALIIKEKLGISDRETVEITTKVVLRDVVCNVPTSLATLASSIFE